MNDETYKLLMDCLSSYCDDWPSISVLQPVDPFLETAGEELRRQIFVTETDGGSLKCLRPEFTIPICLHHLNQKTSSSSSSPSQQCYGYFDKIFRQDETEFYQVGIEDIGDTDISSADARCVSRMVSGLDALGVTDYRVTLGDKDLFLYVVTSLDLPSDVSDRLLRRFGDSSFLGNLVGTLGSGSSSTSDTGDDEADRLARAGDLDALTSHIESLFESTNIPSHIGRVPSRIAERMISKFHSLDLDDSARSVLEDFLSLESPFLESLDLLREFANRSGIAVPDFFVERFERLSDASSASTSQKIQKIFRASFGRRMDYYTGLLFEASTSDGIIAAGGRYDRLCGLLGSPSDIPAIGFSLFPDRITQHGTTKQ